MNEQQEVVSFVNEFLKAKECYDISSTELEQRFGISPGYFLEMKIFWQRDRPPFTIDYSHSSPNKDHGDLADHIRFRRT